MKRKLFLLLFFFLSCAGIAMAQQAADTTQPVDIIFSKNLYWKRVNETTELQILSGDVRLRQGNTVFYCDSCVMNNSGKTFEAFGNVRIVDNDTGRVSSNYLRYLIDTRMAYLTGN